MDKSLQEQVETVINQFTTNKDGSYSLPEDTTISTDVKYAATLEKRRRDTESALGQTKHKLKIESEIRQHLEKSAVGSAPLSLTNEEREALELLKNEDPDTWRSELNRLETEAKQANQTTLAKEVDEIATTATLTARADILAIHNQRHPEAAITDDVLKYDIPPRLTQQLTDGSLSFTEFLTKASSYIGTKRVVKDQAATTIPNIGKVGGGTEPAQASQVKQQDTDYAQTIF